MAETVAKWGSALKHGDDIWVVLYEQDRQSGPIVSDAPRRILPDLIDPKLADDIAAGGIEGHFQLREVEDGWAVVATRDLEPAHKVIHRTAVEDVENHLSSGPRP